ncbi:DUF3617 domain-containing protein [Pleionea sediminis]|uniref:DUF3617 domain-containing protein n=1 Tax=Pleionea sediminis TaxID=2569479 RepID=UPI001185A485|nr:DUF3617 family protein [Pleionea sediminis]
MTKSLYSALFFAIFSNLTLGESLKVNPGLWETKMTRTNPMSGEPVTETTQECIHESEFNPAQLMRGMDGCKLVKNDISEHAVKFKMQCESQGTTSSVEGNYKVKNDQGSGDMQIQMTMMGQTMNMSMKWQSKRLGDCKKG